MSDRHLQGNAIVINWFSLFAVVTEIIKVAHLLYQGLGLAIGTAKIR